MFDFTSRYYTIDTATLTRTDGTVIAYKRRRFLPQGTDMPLYAEVTVAQGDRLDQIAARTLGDPEQFWRICDANNAMAPNDLTVQPGTVIRIPLPQAQV